ncbi:Stationary phase survival protein SurE [Helicobacter sp. NHP19-012]|uniref:5'-nucleotidase SurE n=1 Tax=Helicobacter gastrofelis TaxID=2849642 RepID=A0ABM7SCX5_9HELI|nr:5'/3'-nucleotidase SurE [Helicobacter sp. NHP19-012]BCZ18567.1 Stationary phase survival protein SurE [Helicobacter sp. NHP19-012]
MKPYILLTNDDGYEARGLLVLKEALEPIAEILVVAPKNEKSACGHGVTTTLPLRLEQMGDGYYRVDDGTPTDCVCLALSIAKRPFDLLISGINHGSNMGEDVLYSGTVAGAIEGTIHNIPSIALSQYIKERKLFSQFDFALAKEIALKLVEHCLKEYPLKGRKFLNVNVPQSPHFKGVKITQQGIRLYANNIHCKQDPKGKQYCWMGVNPLRWEEREGTMSDFKALKEGFVSITPITLNMTSYADLEGLQGWFA